VKEYYQHLSIGFLLGVLNGLITQWLVAGVKDVWRNLDYCIPMYERYL